MSQPLENESKNYPLIPYPVCPDESNRVHSFNRICWIAGTVILGVGVLLASLQIAPAIAFSAMKIGGAVLLWVLIDYFISYPAPPQLIGGCDPRKFEDALRILNIPFEEANNVDLINQKFSLHKEALEDKIKTWKELSKTQRIFKKLLTGSEIAYRTLILRPA